MKLSPKAPPEGINTTKERHTTAIAGLLIGAVVIIGLFFVVVASIVDGVVDSLDPETEREVFAEYVPQMLEAIGGDHGWDEQAEEALAPLFARVRNAAPELSYEFTVRVSCQKVPNALALPGGGVIVTAGLLHILETEEELAFVLGHELGHFAHRDHLRGMGRSVALQLGVGMLFLTTGMDPTVALQVALEAFSSAHSREQEMAADATGLDVLEALSPGDVAGAHRALNALHTAGGESGLDQLDFLRSHPVGDVRLASLEGVIAEKGMGTGKGAGTPLAEELKQACGGGDG